MNNHKPLLFCLIGLSYGVGLSFWNFFTTGAGHGTYVLLGVSSSPLGLLGIPIAFFGVSLLWASIGFLLGHIDHHLYKSMFVLLMVAHYVSIIPLLLTEPYGDWEYFSKMQGVMPLFILGGFITYLAGQVAIWVGYSHGHVGRG